MYRLILISLIAIVLSACQNTKNDTGQQRKKPFKGSFQSNAEAIVSLRTFDHYTRRLDEGYGFYVGPDLIVTNLSWIKGAYRIKSSPMDLQDFSSIKGYIAYDINRDLVLLQTTQKSLKPIQIQEAEEIPDSVYHLFRSQRQLFTGTGTVQSNISNDSISYSTLSGSFRNGEPLFASNHRLAGLAREHDDQWRMLHPRWIRKLIDQADTQARSIYELRDKTNKVYISHSEVKGFRILTNKGNIELVLSDKTPQYRDNFIKLVSDHFYDSLLVHRVIKDFLIQTGAADTKYAKNDDVVGWQGPGYTLPMHIVPGLFHQRGMIAASKLPADRNKHNRSDGSQFYIVSGRVFTPAELDDLEEDKGITYTPEQRRIYTSIGGAPYLDGDYTVFGRVTKGMDIVDQMASVKTYAIDRPVEEIRIKTIEILK